MSTLDKLRILLEQNNTQTLQQLATSLSVSVTRVFLLCKNNDLERIQPRSQASTKRQQSINLPPEEAQWVLDESLRLNISKNAVINRTIAFYIEHQEDSND